MARLLAALLLLAATPAAADTLRIATFHTELSRDGPGLLLRDILSGDDPQVAASVEVIAAAGADAILLLGIDHDAEGHALAALATALEEAGLAYPHRFAARPNSGRRAGFDLDGDGRRGEPEDAEGYGWFSGDGGMAILSRLPIDTAAVRNFSRLPWRDLPGSSANAVLSGGALDRLPLHTVAAWDVPLILPGGGRFHLLATHATAPVFDGPEDRNGLRNADQLRFWSLYLDGWSPEGPPFAAETFALLGTFNLDPERGEGRREAVTGLLAHPALRDPLPRRPYGGSETVDWPEDGPGRMRVDYILPAAGIEVTGAGILWPEAEGGTLSSETAARASAHRLVWVDLRL